jgi:DNA-binding Lrp family transcriptional regulator
MRLSKQKRDRISEQILSYLYNNFPQARFTAEISRELARDEEFIKSLMHELQDKKLVTCIRKSPSGAFYSRRLRWRIGNKVYDAYKTLQPGT